MLSAVTIYFTGSRRGRNRDRDGLRMQARQESYDVGQLGQFGLCRRTTSADLPRPIYPNLPPNVVFQSQNTALCASLRIFLKSRVGTM